MKRVSKQIILRPAKVSDYPFLFDLLKMSMKDYYMATYGGWDDKEEYSYLLDSLKDTDCRIIEIDSAAAGVLSVRESEGCLFLNEMQILPEYRDKGIGSALLDRLIVRSEKEGIPICLEVLKVNIKAVRLYERKGFRRNGESETHIKMVRDADKKKPSPQGDGLVLF